MSTLKFKNEELRELLVVQMVENHRLKTALGALIKVVAHPSICLGCKEGSRGTVGIIHAADCPMVAARTLLEKEVK